MRRWLPAALVALTPLLLQAQNQNADQIVQTVVQNELRADASDHTLWMYKDAKKTPEKATIRRIIETKQGNVAQTLEINGRPLNAEERRADEQKIQRMVNDTSVQQRQRRDSKEDGEKARNMMKMLPRAFKWTFVGEQDGTITLSYKPNPDFNPPTRDAQVMSLMAGTMTVDAAQMRLKVLKGALTQDVDFGWGLLGKLHKGGTFYVERAEIEPKLWEIVTTRVHISGRALLFKSIDQNEDEISSDFRHVPADTTLAQAADMLHHASDQNANAQTGGAGSSINSARR